MNEAQINAAIQERDRAAQNTPDDVRKAFLARRHRAGSLELHPFSLAILWLFEELDHPFTKASPVRRNEKGEAIFDEEGNPQFQKVPVRVKDLCRAIYIFAHPEEAERALAGSVEELDEAAFGFARSIAPGDLPAIQAAIETIFQGGMATVPGGGGDGTGNPTMPRSTTPG